MKWRPTHPLRKALGQSQLLIRELTGAIYWTRRSEVRLRQPSCR